MMDFLVKEINSFDTLEEATKQILHNRGIAAEQLADHLNPDFENGLHSPFLLPDMEKATARILQAITAQEKIVVFGDYDADGLPAVTIMDRFFKKIGFENFTLLVPSRNVEGFGLKPLHIEKFVQDKVDLVITVDCGSASVEALELARKNNLEVIVTDHHEVPELTADQQPYALVNPMVKDSKYPFAKICGAAVAFKLVQALLQEIRTQEPEGVAVPVGGWEKWLLDLVAIATVGDMMPLVDENRVLVYFGLIVLNKTQSPGLQALIKNSMRNSDNLAAEDITFSLAPRLNAASRLGEEHLALDLLTSADFGQAQILADKLEKLNRSRKGHVTAMVKAARAQIDESAPVIVVGDIEWLPGMCGLLASRLCDQYQRPVFVWGRGPGEQIKGSCRSNAKSAYEIMAQTDKEVLASYGGHHLAGGFVVNEAGLHKLSQALATASEQVSTEVASVKISPAVDYEITLPEINEKLWRELKALEPFGFGYPRPVFLLKKIQPQTITTFGSFSSHTKIVISSSLEAISFNNTPEDLGVSIEGQALNMIANLEFDSYRRRPNLRIIEIKI